VKKHTALIIALMVSGCASQVKVDNLEGARKNTDNYNALIDERLRQLESESDNDNFMERVDYPLISGVVISEEKDLPEYFEDEWVFNPYEDVRLVDVVKSLQSEFDVVISVKDDVYNPNSASVNENSDDAATVNVINEIRTEGNLVKESRVKIPSGSRYNGSLKGFLNYITSLLGITWDYIPSKNKVMISRYVQKSYGILVEQDSDVWEATEDAINEFRSEGGGVKSNPIAQLITVVDTIEVHKMVEELIADINDSLKISANFRVEIMSARLTDEDANSFGMNLSHVTGGWRQLALSSTATAVPGAGGLTATVLEGSPFSGSQLVAQSISSKSEISNVSVKYLQAANNTTATIEQINTVPVLTRYTPPVINENTTVPASAVLEDKRLGFELKLSPTIYSNANSMRLKFELDNTDMVDLQEIKLNDDGQFLQALVTEEKSFEKWINMEDKETLVFALEDDSAQFKKTQMVDDSWYSWILNAFGNSKNDSSTKSYYVVAITPTINAGAKL
jgi:hypothetical protein